MKWPFVWRSTFEALQRRNFSIAAHNDDLQRALAQAQMELHKHKILLAGRSGVMKVLRTENP